MRLIVTTLLSLAACLTASAGNLSISDLGNGLGWNDGADYTGYVTLNLDGTVYRGLCIDALHVTVGNSWSAVYIPLGDSRIAGVMQDYFGVTDPAVYLSKLGNTMVGYGLLNKVGSNETLNNRIQHEVWAQFDPAQFADTGYLEAAAGTLSINPSQFGLIVDANWATGHQLEQAFLVNSLPVLQQNFDLTAQAPEPSTTLLIGCSLLGACLWRGRRQRTLAR